MKNTMSSTPASWGHRIAVEVIDGVPFLMYVERPKQIGDLFAFAERWGARPYVVQGERVLTFAGLKSAVGAKTRALAAAGIKRGDRVFMLGWNGPEWAVNFWACVRAGAVPVAANAWWSEGELADALGAEARAYARGSAGRRQDADCLAPRTVGDRAGPDRRGGRGDPGC